jgi:hypothetical protein
MLLATIASAIAAALAFVFRDRLLAFKPVATALGTTLDTEAPVGSLTTEARDTLVAFGEALIPSAFAGTPAFTAPGSGLDPRSPAEVLRESLDSHATGAPGYRGEFQIASGFLDRLARDQGLPGFGVADLPARRRLIEARFGGYVRQARRRVVYYLTPSGRRTARTWEFVARPLLAAFYRSSWGWRVVGYPRKPGECSNLVDYQSPVASSTPPA